MRHLLAGFVVAWLAAAAPHAQNSPDWQAVQDEALSTLRSYIRIDTSNPPGDVTKAADFLSDILKRDGITVTRYESAPGKSIVVARLKGRGAAKPLLLMNHMDVVPTDSSQGRHAPFGGDVADGNVWGRGAMDMKGPGVVQLMAFLLLNRQHIPLDRDVILMADPDEEVGGALGARWMLENHYDDISPEYILDEGGVGSRDLFALGKLVFGISVAEKKLIWLKLRARGLACHGSQPNEQNPNDHLIRALAHLMSEPMPSGSLEVI